MRNEAKLLRDIQEQISKLKYNIVDPSNIPQNKAISVLNKNNSNITKYNKNDDSLTIENDTGRDVKNKSIEANLEPNKKNINQRKEFLYLNGNFKNKNILSPRIIKPKKLIIKNASFNIDNNNLLPKLNFNRRYANNNSDIYYMRGDFSLNNKYFSDMVSFENNNKENNNICNEKEDMETADIKIKQLAKDLNLFQNDKNDKKNILDDGVNNLLPSINSDNSSIFNSNRQSRIPPGTPRVPINSGKCMNNLENCGFSKILNKRSINRLNSPSLSQRFNIKRRMNMSPLCNKERDNFLYKNIFYYFNNKKYPKIMKKFINNKMNICYAENEKQFEKRIIQMNEINRKRGKTIHKISKGETEQRAASLQHRVEFIKKIFDYAYPNILIYRIKNKNDMEKREIKENNLKNLMKEKELKEKLKIQKYSKSSLLHRSIIIRKIEKL